MNATRGVGPGPPHIPFWRRTLGLRASGGGTLCTLATLFSVPFVTPSNFREKWRLSLLTPLMAQVPFSLPFVM